MQYLMCFHSQHSRVDLRQKAVMHEAVVEEMGEETLMVNYYTHQECTARWKMVQEYVLPSTRPPRPGISSVSFLRPMRWTSRDSCGRSPCNHPMPERISLIGRRNRVRRGTAAFKREGCKLGPDLLPQKRA